MRSQKSGAGFGSKWPASYNVGESMQKCHKTFVLGKQLGPSNLRLSYEKLETHSHTAFHVNLPGLAIRNR